MKKIIIITSAIVVLLNTSCAVKSSSLQRMVQEKVNETKKTAPTNSNVEVKINKNIELVNQCKQEKSSFIPALLYWGWNSEVICEFSKATVENEIQNIVKNKITNLGLEKSVENKKIIVNINDLPTKFKFQDKGDVAILIVAYVMSGKRYFTTEQTDFKGNYQIINEENKIILEKEFKHNTKITPQTDNYKSTKKLSWQYLEVYNKELERFVALILEDIKTNLISKPHETTMVNSTQPQ